MNNDEKLKKALETGKFNLILCPKFHTPRTPLDTPTVKVIDGEIKRSGAFYTPGRKELFRFCGACPAHSTELRSRPFKVQKNNTR
jgi:hypothetical protein